MYIIFGAIESHGQLKGKENQTHYSPKVHNVFIKNKKKAWAISVIFQA